MTKQLHRMTVFFLLQVNQDKQLKYAYNLFHVISMTQDLLIFFVNKVTIFVRILCSGFQRHKMKWLFWLVKFHNLGKSRRDKWVKILQNRNNEEKVNEEIYYYRLRLFKKFCIGFNNVDTCDIQVSFESAIFRLLKNLVYAGNKHA